MVKTRHRTAARSLRAIKRIAARSRGHAKSTSRSTEAGGSRAAACVAYSWTGTSRGRSRPAPASSSTQPSSTDTLDHATTTTTTLAGVLVLDCPLVIARIFSSKTVQETGSGSLSKTIAAGTKEPRHSCEAGALEASIRTARQAGRYARARRPRRTAPSPPNPTSIIAHIAGSGTPPTTFVVSEPPALMGIDG